LIFTSTASQFSYTDTAITGGNLYCYYVTAFNALGGESESSVHLRVLPITVPSGLTAPTLVSKTLNSLTVQWAAPTSDGDSEIERYILYIKAEFESTYHEIYRGKSTSYKATLLTTGFNYQFKVRAINAAGMSDLSPASS
jgi:fibronectin type 3 domain-containing protein